MSVTDNDNFPRGGKKIVNSAERIKRKHEENLFALAKPQKAKKARKEKPKKIVRDDTEEVWQKNLRFQGTLTYNKIQEGMLILSCVRHITNLAVQVEFPGLTFGSIPINEISDAFTHSLTNQLKEGIEDNPVTALRKFIKIGQLLPSRIVSVERLETGHRVQASINPKIVNSDKKQRSFLKGEMIWANVLSELDHGYELTVGLNNCRIFLPHKNIDVDKKFETGEVLFCTINKVESVDFATTLTVSAKKEHVTKVQPTDLAFTNFIPGMKVEMLIEEITPHGIKGQFLDNFFGYIDETQMFRKRASKKLKEGGTVAAYVLYVEPITKVTYLTLNGLDDLPEPEFQSGKIISSEVTSVVNRGLYLKLGDAVGFVTNKRLLTTLPKDASLDVTQAVRNKYAVGSRRECRILDYNYMQQLYICTFEKHLIKEKIFSAKNLSVGQRVQLVVDKIIPNGLIVKVGHVQGFVPNLHLSNVAYSETIKAKFSEGMSVEGRVLNITPENNVIITLKPKLVESNNCLMKIEDAVPNSQFVGFVVQTKVSGALIAFYGNLTGWITNKVLNSGNPGGYVSPEDYFFIGQVVTVWISGLKNDKIQLSLTPAQHKTDSLKVGQYLKGTVTNVESDYLEVECGPKKKKAIIPTIHFSSNLELCQVLKNMFKPGDEISNLLCINNTDPIPIVSRREALAFRNESLKIHYLQQLKKNRVLRCSFLEATETGIYVTAPIKDYSDKIFVSRENINLRKDVNFLKHQSLLGKILDVNSEERKIELAIVKKKISKKDINSVIDPIIQVFNDFDFVTKFFCKKKAELTKYSIGSRVKCKVKDIDSKGNCIVSVVGDLNGKIPFHLAPSNCSLGQVINGVVLHYNFFDNVLELSGKNVVNQKINEIQDGIIKKPSNTSCIGKILLLTKFYAIGVLTDKHYNRQLFYSPLCFREHDLRKAKLKVSICKQVGHRIIAVPKRVALSLAKQLKKTEKTKNKKKIIERTQQIKSKEDEKIINDSPVKSCAENDEEIVTIEDENDEKIGTMKQDDSSVKSDDENDGEIVTIEDENDEIQVKNDEEITTMKRDDDDFDKHSEDIPEENDTDTSDDDSENSETVIKNVKLPEIPKELLLSGANSFYADDSLDLPAQESSSDDEEEEQQQSKKKKKMSAAERAEAARKEEERIAQIEKQLADTESTPQSAEQFDRLLLANPNSSELWLQYIAMHVAATELEKARAVGKRAIETINMTLVKEKFNIWIALLNLENMYGTKESFDRVFEDAVRYNNALDIYLSVIKMLASCGKLVEMEEKIKKIKSKEKQNTKMWLEVGKVYYTLQRFREARNIKDAAIKSILDKKRQFDIIIRFAILEFQLGEAEQAIANFESILETYPTKVNIWTIYVDQLVKQKHIDHARKVLERAVSQKFAPKTMKILFQKFISFEEQHGTLEAIQKVKELAKNYVSRLSRK